MININTLSEDELHKQLSLNRHQQEAITQDEKLLISEADKDESYILSISKQLQYMRDHCSKNDTKILHLIDENQDWLQRMRHKLKEDTENVQLDLVKKRRQLEYDNEEYSRQIQSKLIQNLGGKD